MGSWQNLARMENVPWQGTLVGGALLGKLPGDSAWLLLLHTVAGPVCSLQCLGSLRLLSTEGFVRTHTLPLSTIPWFLFCLSS